MSPEYCVSAKVTSIYEASFLESSLFITLMSHIYHCLIVIGSMKIHYLNHENLNQTLSSIKF